MKSKKRMHEDGEREWESLENDGVERRVVGSMEENIGIYRRYIVYQEGATRYFMEKNRRGDISVNITKISAIYRFGEIYRRFFQKIASVAKNR